MAAQPFGGQRWGRLTVLDATSDVQWARAFEMRVGELIVRTHPSWWEPLPAPAAQGPVREWHVRWLSIPALQACAHGDPSNALGLWPQTTVRRLLSARALWWRRRALWRAVDAPTRARLQDLVGREAYRLLLRETRILDAEMADGDELPDDQTLAWEGFCWLQQDGLLTDAACRRILRLEFPRDLAPTEIRTRVHAKGGLWWRSHLSGMAKELPTWWSGYDTTAA